MRLNSSVALGHLTVVILVSGVSGCSSRMPGPVVRAPVIKPTWASAAGADMQGSWADLTVNGVVQRMRYIPAGTFTMGSAKGETNRYIAEKQHRVTISSGYWLADSECTQAMWQAVMESTPSQFTGDTNRPVEMVSYDDCLGFISRLNGSNSESVFRLPTEAQWEYACRAEWTTPYNGLLLDAVGWFCKNSDGKTHAVKQKQSNAWGLYDMHGNVGEWCADWINDYGDMVTDPLGPTSGSYRVIRGGSWDLNARDCRSACRYNSEPVNRGNGLGFRLSVQCTL